MRIQEADIEVFCDILRRSGKKIAFTNGCFDILHAGHVRYLNKAKELADVLIIGLNADESVRELKGPSRPINTELDRAEVIEGLRVVDAVVVFKEKTAVEIIRKIKPDIYIKGGDYNLETLPENEIIKKIGGKVVFIDLVEGRSTTSIIDKVKRNLL